MLSLLPPATGAVDKRLEEPHAKELWKIPLADNTVRIRTWDISEDLCDELTDQLTTSDFSYSK
jgi:hypothetical protein